MATMGEAYDVTPRELDHGNNRLSCYTYKTPEKQTLVAKRIFVIPRSHKDGSKKSSRTATSNISTPVTETDRRYRINPELIPLLQNRNSNSADGEANRPKTRLPPCTPGPASQFETECIRKIWTEVSGPRGLPRDHRPRRGTPEIKLGEKGAALEELEKRATSHSFTLGIRAKSLADLERNNRCPVLMASAGKRTTIRSQRAQRNELKSAQFYTAITKPPASREPTPIRALTQMAPAIPNLYSSRPASHFYHKRDLDIWRKEVSKDVPVRPDLTIPAEYKTGKTWGNVDEDIMKMYEPFFYRVNKNQPNKFFVVDKEWYSERGNLKKVGSNVNII